MLRAALTSRSWTAPQWLHSHSLIPRPAIPFGLEGCRVPHSDQVWVIIRSESSRYRPPSISDLYERSEESRVGKECVSTGSFTGSQKTSKTTEIPTRRKRY